MNENDILMYENDEFDSNLEDFYNYFMKQNETDLLRDFIFLSGDILVAEPNWRKNTSGAFGL